MPPIGFSCAWKGSCCQQRGPAASTATTTDTTAPKTQTTSPTTPRFSAFFAEVVCTLGTTPPQTVISPSPNGGNGVIRTTTRRRHADSQPLMLQNPHRHRRGGRRRDRRAGLRGTRAAEPVGGRVGQRANAPIEAHGADGRSGRHRHHRQPNFACNSPAARINTSSKTAEYQRSEPNPDMRSRELHAKLLVGSHSWASGRCAEPHVSTLSSPAAHPASPAPKQPAGPQATASATQ